MRLKELVQVADSGIARLRSKAAGVVAGRSWGDEHRPTVEVRGWVKMVMRERGKIVPGTHREGKNVWTNVGKEYLALKMSIASAPSNSFRTDNVAYIGVGTGSQVEDASVLALITPVAYATGLFLAALDIPPTFPLLPTRTAVQFSRTFAENEITLGVGTTVPISELGLFTDGSPLSSFSPGSRDLTLASAGQQSPNAYKTFEPVDKTDSLELEVNWEIRF